MTENGVGKEGCFPIDAIEECQVLYDTELTTNDQKQSGRLQMIPCEYKKQADKLVILTINDVYQHWPSFENQYGNFGAETWGTRRTRTSR